MFQYKDADINEMPEMELKRMIIRLLKSTKEQIHELKNFTHDMIEK